MTRVRMMVLLGGCVCVWVTSVGCVARDEYLRTDFARRKALERCEVLERDLTDERNRSLALETEAESLRRELGTKTALADSLKTENDRLGEFAQKLQAQMDDILAKGVGDIQVVEVKLPPELDRALQDLAAQYPDMVEYDAKRGAVRWKSDLTFDKGSDVVRPGVLASLQAFANIVNSGVAEAFEVVVVGHTDDLRIGPITAKLHPTNWHLSAHRAIAVMSALHQDGVGYDRMGVMGYGEFRPAQPNPTSGGCEANRRVEIFLVSNKDAASQSARMAGSVGDLD